MLRTREDEQWFVERLNPLSDVIDNALMIERLRGYPKQAIEKRCADRYRCGNSQDRHAVAHRNSLKIRLRVSHL